MASPKSHCGICQRDMQNDAQLQGHLASPRHARRAELLPILRCETCQRDFQGHKCLQGHLESLRHARKAKLTCAKCHGHFGNPAALLEHQNKTLDSHCPITGCHLDSEDNATHLLEDRHRSPPLGGKKEKKFACGVCGKKFVTKRARKWHSKSGVHNPLFAPFRCTFSEKCGEMFVAPSAMLLHVESGTCVSGWSREEMNRKVVEADVNRLISLPLDLEETAGNDEEDTNDSEEGWEMMNNELSRQNSWSSSSFASVLAPSLVSDSVSIVSLQQSPVDSQRHSELLAPAQSPSSGVFLCPLCPQTTFKSAHSLAQHEKSPAHSPLLFHLPASTDASPSTPQRRFTTLSGMAQCFESRVRGLDKSDLQELLGMLDETISEYWPKEIRLLLPE